MKAKLILLPAILYFTGSVLAQDKNPNQELLPLTTIVVDFFDEKGIDPLEIAKHNSLKRGQYFRLKIHPVNTYVYDVSMVNDDVDTAQDLPGNLLDLVDFGGLKSALNNLSSVSGVVREFSASDSDAALLQSELLIVENGESLKSFFAAVQSDYRSVFSDLDAIYVRTDALFTRVENFQNSMTTLNKKMLGTVPSPEEIRTELNTFDETKASVKNVKRRLQQINTRFSEVAESQRDAIAVSKELKAASADITKVHDRLIKASNGLMDQLSSENYGKFSATLIGILNNLDFTYTSLPIQRHSDLNEIKITLKPRDKNAKLSTYSTILRIPNIEKSFWGISTGFYATANPEKKYSLIARSENGETQYDFLEEDIAKTEVGINTMVRYGHRFGEFYDIPSFWHFGFGAGLSIDQKFKPRLMAGTGWAFGHKNKMLIDLGAVHMYFDTLSSAFQTAGNTSQPEDFLVSTTKIQAYISVGYLIGL